MSEAELQERVRGMCAQLGLYHYHPHDSRRSEPGWPDSTIIGPNGVMFRELKNATRQLTSAQRAVGYRLQALSQDWAVWRPADLLSGRVAAELAALAGKKLARLA